MTRSGEIDALFEAAAALPGFAASAGLPIPDAGTLATLDLMLGTMPADMPLPRLASDTGGCVLARWVRDGHAVLARTVEGDTVTATVGPGSCSDHLEPFRWAGSWPAELVRALGP